jgi:hypothetical protein
VVVAQVALVDTMVAPEHSVREELQEITPQATLAEVAAAILVAVAALKTVTLVADLLISAALQVAPHLQVCKLAMDKW